MPQLAIARSRALAGVHAPAVDVEVHLANGLPGLSIVGLPETAVRESKDRVRAALQQSGFEFPARRITINLSPADLPKEGSRFDLPIALGILAASGQVPGRPLEDCEWIGELALDGRLRPVPGVLPAALAGARAGRSLVVPAENAPEGMLSRQARVRCARHLLEVVRHLRGEAELPEAADLVPPDAEDGAADWPDLADVRGHHQARRALEVAAAGGHNLLFVGPPGTGKSLLAQRLPGLLPPLDEDEALETASVASICGLPLQPRRWRRRPWRTPHHTASAAALVGGGSQPRPGEISLAHNGLLFLDELPEFDRRVLEVLREPLETGRILVSRAARQAEFPARFQLVAAMNPCPCGYYGDPQRNCRCSPEQIRRYRARLSGPLLDRIDLQVEVPRQSLEVLEGPPGEASATVRARVYRARERQQARQGCLNQALAGAELEAHARPEAAGRALLARAMERLHLSARAYHRVLRVARTLADLEGAARVAARHVGEALQYRCLDRAFQ
ncbi:MAG: ATP-dependent protease [Gammaproteobacteria bacterium]|nr:MAG: ATP-dependent protease [Gammaproteobacteria bacterium]